MIELWASNLIGLAVALVLLAILIRKTGDPISFATFFSIAWGVNLLVSQAQPSSISRPTLETTLILYLAWWLFLLGAILWISKDWRPKPSSSPINRPNGITAIVILILLQTAAIIYEVEASGLGLGEYIGSFTGGYTSLRLTGELRTIDLPWFLEIWRWVFVAYVPLAFCMRRQNLISRSFLGLVLVLALVSTLLRVTRAPILQVAVSVFVSWITLYRPNLRAAAAAATIVLVVFGVFFLQVQSSLIILDPLSEYQAATESLYSYVGGPAKAFDLLLRGYYPEVPNGVYSLESITFVLEKLKLYDGRPDLVRPYVYVPYPTNVYTFLDAYALDLGVVGIIGGSLLTGMVVGWSYLRLRRKLSAQNLIVYSYLAYCCVMTPMNNEFIRFAVPLTLLMAFALDITITNREPIRAHRRLVRRGLVLGSAKRHL